MIKYFETTVVVVIDADVIIVVIKCNFYIVNEIKQII